GTALLVQWDARTVRVLDLRTGALLREHERQHPGQYREHPDDRPRRTPPTTLELLARAAAVGPHVGELATSLHADDPLRAVRRIQGLLDALVTGWISEKAVAETLVRSLLQRMQELERQQRTVRDQATRERLATRYLQT